MPLFLPLVIAVLMLAVPAAAQEVKKEPTSEASAAQEQTPVTEWLAAETAVVDGLADQAAKETYFILRNKYGLIRAVRVVKRDVGNAVQACGQQNPEIQDKMTQRFKDWTNAVDPVLKTAEGYLKQEIDTQSVVSADTFRDMLKLNDKAFNFQESKIEKRPVTELTACEKLLASMDRTETEMISLMQQTLLPESVIRDSINAEEKPAQN